MIDLQDLHKQYREGGRPRRVLAGFSVHVPSGQRLALIGRSGVGKSTLLNLISGMDSPDSGVVRVHGVDITAMNERQRTRFRRRDIGFVFQFFNLIPTLTVMENLLLPLELNAMLNADGRGRAAGLLDTVGLADRRESFPEQLSGGEQQRIAIARALVHRPRVLLADEPTGTLDEDTGREVLDLLETMTREEQMTMVMVTHSVELAGRMDRVLRLSEGQPVEVR